MITFGKPTNVYLTKWHGKKVKFLYLLTALSLGLNGCVTKGLLSDRYEKSYYHIPNLLTEESLRHDPTFIVIGDTQPAWRGLYKFLTVDNWLTWKMFIFPIYELYWLGNGAVGLVNWLRHMPDYGYETRTMMRDVVHARAKSSTVGFVLNTGDKMGQDGRRPANWNMFLTEYYHESSFLKDIPFVPTPGNHERCNDEIYGRKNFEAVFDYPMFYKLEFPSIDLFVVDSDIIIDWQKDLNSDVQETKFEQWFVSEDPNHPAWLEAELSKSTKPFKIVSMHHCPFSYGYHWKDWYKCGYGNDAEIKRKKLVDLFRKYGVQLVLSGHDHIYQHNVLHWKDGEKTPDKDIHFMVSSGGGTVLRKKTSRKRMSYLTEKYRSEGFIVKALMQEKTYRYCVVSVSPDQIIVQTFAVSEDHPFDNTLLEEFTIPSPRNRSKSNSKQSLGYNLKQEKQINC